MSINEDNEDDDIDDGDIDDEEDQSERRDVKEACHWLNDKAVTDAQASDLSEGATLVICRLAQHQYTAQPIPTHHFTTNNKIVSASTNNNAQLTAPSTSTSCPPCSASFVPSTP